MTILRLNIRHALPQTSIHQEQARVERSIVVPAELHTPNEQARSNKTITQPTTDIQSYQSRRAWGARNLTDLTREFGQQGLADVRSGTSRRTEEAWTRARDGAKPGDDIMQQVMNNFWARYDAHNVLSLELMEGPEITVNESEIVGESERGDVTEQIETTPFADIRYNRGTAETYLADRGFIRRWVTMNEYDIYA